MSEPSWLTQARSYIGMAEVHGAQHNPRILRLWTAIRAPFTDDETPWCAAFVGGCLEAAGVKSSRSAAARSYLKWGSKLTRPVQGCVVVFERGPVNGHVAFLVGFYGANPVCLGGNQGDAVNVKTFDAARVLGYRWPADVPLADVAPAQLAQAARSSAEA